MPGDRPSSTARDEAHQHAWNDTGFSDLDECVCGATRSVTGGRVMEPAELAALKERVRDVS